MIINGTLRLSWTSVTYWRYSQHSILQRNSPPYYPNYYYLPIITQAALHSTRKAKSFYGKTSALILSVMIRWGTQAEAINSVYHNKDAFKLYLLDSCSSINNTVIDLLGSRSVWHVLEELRDLILPIQQDQPFSESQNSYLCRIVNRWLEIR